MASSNRHWPSMFRSNPSAPCDFHRQQPDMNNQHSKPSLISSGIDQESGRTPGETKPRWNPRPEQIRILEGIFNSGVVNPARDEIRRIRLRLQEYGHVADANVFYWFQNRKSRTKNKLRAAQSAAQGQLPTGRAALTRAPAPRAAPAPPVTPPRLLLAPAGPLQAPTSSSSSSSDSSSGSSNSVTMKPASMASAAAASQTMLPPSSATTIGLFAPPVPACQLYYLQNHPMQTPMPTPSVRELITSTPETPPPLLMQWPPQSTYLPPTELGGVFGSQAHAHTPVSPGVHLPGMCSDAALGQHEIVDMTSYSKLGLGGGQFFSTTTTGTTDLPSHRTDAVSAVFTEDEKIRLGSLHYGLGLGAFITAAAGPAHAAFTAAAADISAAAVLPCAAPSINNNNAAAASPAFTDQLQGLVDTGLLMGGGAPAAPAMVVAVAAARPDAGVQWYSVPAMTRLDVGLFGEAAVLLRHTGEPVPLDGSGVTVEPLQHGAVYYVLAGVTTRAEDRSMETR